LFFREWRTVVDDVAFACGLDSPPVARPPQITDQSLSAGCPVEQHPVPDESRRT
jgi:hypothetical protein